MSKSFADKRLENGASGRGGFKYSARHLMGTLSTVVLLVVFALLSPRAAAAQTKTPVSYRVSVVLTDADDSPRAYEALVGALEEDADVTLVPSERIWTASNDRNVDRRDYRKGSRREELGSTFAAIMDETGVDAMILIDMISRGRRVQAVVIGPDGSELADIRTATKSATASRKALQRELVDPVLAEVRSVIDLEARRARAEAELREKQGDKSAKGAEQPDDEAAAASDQHQAGTGRTDAYGSIAQASNRAFKLEAGGFFGRRSFSAESSQAYQINHATPQLGAHLRGQLRLLELDEGRGGVFVEMEGAWAPYTVEFTALGEFRQEGGRHLSGRLEAVYRQQLADALSVRAAVGGDAVSDTIDANQIFTGSRYANARLTLGFVFHPIHVFEIGFSGGVMPVFLAETSGGSYGDGARGLGYTGRVGINFTLSSNLDLSAAYDLRAYQTHFSKPAVVDTPIQTQELFHAATFGLAYGL